MLEENLNVIPWFLMSESLPPRGLRVFVWKKGSSIDMAARPSEKEISMLNDIYETEFSESTFDNADWHYPVSDFTHWAYMVASPDHSLDA